MIVVIDNYDSFTYNLVQYLGQMTSVAVYRNDRVTVDAVRAMKPAGIVISPGPGRPEDAGISVALVHELGPEVPVLGVCLGHQAIALAYGGRVVPASRLMHGKADQVHHQGLGILKNLPTPSSAGRYHSLMVDVDGVPELHVDAESDDGTVMAISHRKYPVFGIQFHPESVLTPDGMTILTHFVDVTLAKEGARL